MSVSSVFFDGVKAYSDARVERTLGDTLVQSREWGYHPLNWNCEGDTYKCFNNASQEFFESTENEEFDIYSRK